MYIMSEEKAALGFEVFKDRFTLLLGANLTGDWKLKPIMVYHVENPCALKGHNKSSLPIHWYANASGWMMGHIFHAYSEGTLMHKLKEYCTSRALASLRSFRRSVSSASSWRRRSALTSSRKKTSALCCRRLVRSCRQRTLMNWRSSGVRWRRKWRLSSSPGTIDYEASDN